MYFLIILKVCIWLLFCYRYFSFVRLTSSGPLGFLPLLYWANSVMNNLYAVFRKYCREHGKKLILGAFDQFVFIYFIILLINCQKQPALSLKCVFKFGGRVRYIYSRYARHIWNLSHSMTMLLCFSLLLCRNSKLRR